MDLPIQRWRWRAAASAQYAFGKVISISVNGKSIKMPTPHCVRPESDRFANLLTDRFSLEEWNSTFWPLVSANLRKSWEP